MDKVNLGDQHTLTYYSFHVYIKVYILRYLSFL